MNKRTIKFRAWTTIGNMQRMDLLTGFLYYGKNQECMNLFTVDPIIGYLVATVDQTILMQSTGILDKNGKEIYEGDIRREEYESDEGDERLYYLCMWIPEASRFAWISYSEYLNYQDNSAKALDWTLINTYGVFANESKVYVVCGNIYQHPHLFQ